MHELVLEGKGISVCINSAFSSIGGFILSLPIFYLFLNINISKVSEFVPLVLIIVSAYLIGTEREFLESRIKKILQAFTVFALSGILGYFCFGNYNLLLPILTGLFASPILLTSIFTSGSIKKQDIEFYNPKLKDVISGVFAGSFVSIFPSISSGVATLISSNHLRSGQRIASAISSANTTNAILCFSIFISSNKVRSGAVSVFGKLTSSFDPLKLIEIGIVVALISVLITVSFAIIFGKFAERIKPSKLSLIVFTFNIALIYILTKGYGLFIFAISTLVGLLTIVFRVRRVNCMGALIIPTILLYLF